MSTPARSLLAVLAAAAMAYPACTQQQPSSSPVTSTLRTSTQIVVVDVTVTDRSGTPVHGLAQQDLILTEDKAPQTIRHFEEHTDREFRTRAQHESLPPGTFTNALEPPPSSTLNILLIDSLNTPAIDQGYLRKQLIEYVRHANPSQRTAIFGMNSGLVLLQGFSTDPALLRAAVDKSGKNQHSILSDDPSGANQDSGTGDLASQLASMGMAAAAINYKQFGEEQQSFELVTRVRTTISLLNALAHYLAQYPGRKNLIWFSGSFPLSVSPDPNPSGDAGPGATVHDPFAIAANLEDDFRETTNLLARAQVAVYPIDARGTITQTNYDASLRGSSYVTDPRAYGNDLQSFQQSTLDDHRTMDLMAQDTGGKAFYNNNGLALAAAQAIAEGSNYYTLTYSPSNRKWDGSFRRLHVELNSTAKASGMKLHYRRGYYAIDPASPHRVVQTATRTDRDLKDTSSATGLARLALQRGAPTYSGMLMKVRVLPSSTHTDDSPAKDSTVSPRNPMRPPFRRYTVDLLALTQQLGFHVGANGHFVDGVQISMHVLNAAGDLLSVSDKTLSLDLDDETYTRLLRSGLQYRAEVTAPAREVSFLRIGVEDRNTHRIGAWRSP